MNKKLGVTRAHTVFYRHVHEFKVTVLVQIYIYLDHTRYVYNTIASTGGACPSG